MSGGGGGESELNLVPYLDIMINLVMFLLAVTANIVQLREAPVLVPTLVSDNNGGSSVVDPKGFLTVTVSPRGFAVVTSYGVPASDLPRGPSGLPFADLTRVLRQYKDAATAPGQPGLKDALQIVADSETPYKEVVATMDAARMDGEVPLFPGIQLALLAAQ